MVYNVVEQTHLCRDFVEINEINKQNKSTFGYSSFTTRWGWHK